jgi:hypothetical protein
MENFLLFSSKAKEASGYNLSIYIYIEITAGALPFIKKNLTGEGRLPSQHFN